MTCRGIRSLVICFCFVILPGVLLAGDDQSAVIRSIRFEGNRTFTDEQLCAGFERVAVGARYDPDLVDFEIQTKILSRYRKEGFIEAAAQKSVSAAVDASQPRGFDRAQKARHSTAASEVAALPDSVDLLITIEEGSLYRYRSLEIQGGENLEIRSLFGQLPGDLMNYEELKQSFESVKRLLAEQGFLDREVIPTVRPDEASHTVAVTVHISPGRPYLVSRVNFANSGSEAQDKQLREAWVLEPGSVFRPSLLTASIARVNDLHLFQPLTEADCDVIRRPEPNSVDILVRLRPLVK